MDSGELNVSKDETIKFIHPKYLPNTQFISKKPKLTLVMFREMLDRFNERYNFSDDKIEKQIRGSKGVIKYIFNEDNKSVVSTLQAIIDDMHNYDKYYEDYVKRRLYKSKKPFNIADNFILNFDLFCARHQVSRAIGSNWAFGNPSYIKMLERGDISLRVKTIDKVMLDIYRIDQQHIKIMGDTYVKWKKYGQ